MPDRLPVRVGPYQLAEKGQVLSGKLVISKMPRLKQLIAGTSGNVECELTFSKKGRQYFLAGHVKGCLKLTCQRCLEPYDQEIDSHFSLLLVADDREAESVQETADPLIVIDDELDISTIVEDEILLSMPAIPMHDKHDCIPHIAMNEIEPLPDTHQENPFAVLEKLKKH